MSPFIAKFCYECKHHFATECGQTVGVASKSPNQLFAENLGRIMQARELSQAKVGKDSRLGQRTISGYLALKDPTTTASGKEKSAKLSELGMVADALGIAPWQLLVPIEEERDELLERRVAELVDLFRGMSDRAKQELMRDARKLYAVTREQSGEIVDSAIKNRSTGTHGAHKRPPHSTG